MTSEQGKEAIVAFLKGDEFFGEACANGETLRLSTATALTACTITRITKAEIHRLIRAEPDFAEFFYLAPLVWQFIRNNWLSTRIFKSYDDLVDHCCEAWNKLVVISLGAS